MNVLQTAFNGELVKKGDRYEGSLMALTTSDPDFVNLPPPIGKMPDLTVGWVSIRMKDCNTIENVIPFFGIYFGAGVWTPGLGGPTFAGKKPLVDPPDVDMLDRISDGSPILETYRRLPNRINPELLHK